jgi:hypothetical protein
MARTVTDDSPEAKLDLPTNVSLDDIERVYIAELNAIDAKIDVLKVERKNLRTKVKAQADTNVTQLDKHIKRSQQDADEQKKFYENEERYAGLTNQAVRPTIHIAQGELFDSRIPDGERSKFKWGARGYADGLQGRGNPEDPGKDCPPDCLQDYATNWTKGQAVLADAFLAKQSLPDEGYTKQ